MTKFCQKLGDSQNGTICKSQQVVNDDDMEMTQIWQVIKGFQKSCTSVQKQGIPQNTAPRNDMNPR